LPHKEELHFAAVTTAYAALRYHHRYSRTAAACCALCVFRMASGILLIFFNIALKVYWKFSIQLLYIQNGL
jgi:hypothetical protein